MVAQEEARMSGHGVDPGVSEAGEFTELLEKQAQCEILVSKARARDKCDLWEDIQF